ncbi:hypothetical protein ACFWNN_30115 [Lentzea sp. NPDC058450]|uniref:hypothetical protein n=1 Tax=Lentzea sp. NPDC058450 TaxID=3346505 RepID=UPI00366A1725
MIDVVLEFATTGRIGLVHAGMALAEAEDLLGPGRPHPALRRHPEFDGYPIHWESLSLLKSGDRASEVNLELSPEHPLRLPEVLGSRHVGELGSVLMEDFLAALDEAACGYGSARSEEGVTHLDLESGVTAIFIHSEDWYDVPVQGDYLSKLRTRS